MTISEPIEHGASDPIGTGTPDEIECEILRFATTMPEPARAGNWGSGLWTKNLLLEIGQLGKQHHCYVCGCREVEPEQGRWLFDLAWLGEHDMPLALESEWGDQEAVDRDFQKMQAVRLLDDGTRKLDESAQPSPAALNDDARVGDRHDRGRGTKPVGSICR